MNTYLFYDIETTGLNKAFDQVLEFSAIRTDMNLKEIDRHNISVRIRPDVIPSPQAILTNRISIENSLSKTCEFEATKLIHILMNTPGTISIGYNTLGFDDEFLRFSFYRNLLPPYTHQYANGCFRMDLFPMAALFFLYKKDIINWPLIEGKPTLKLEHINKANKLASGMAHDAIVDVKATVALARRFCKEDKMWDYLMGCFDKKIDSQRTNDLPVFLSSPYGDHLLGLMISGEFGPDQNYQAPVISLGNSIPYKNQSLWLRLDLPEIKETNEDNIQDSTWVIRKKFGEPGILLPPLKRYWKFIGTERREIIEENKSWLSSNQVLFKKIIDYYRSYRYPEIPNIDLDAALYTMGFFSPFDEELFRQFHEASIEEKGMLIEQFSKPNVRKIAIRVLGRNYADNLPKNYASDFKAYMDSVAPAKQEDALVDYRGAHRMTPMVAMDEMDKLKDSSSLNNEQLKMINALEGYIKERF